MNEEVFKKLLKKLQGINYFFISGLSIAIHTNGKRIPGDIDMAIHENDVDKFANSVGAKAEKRIIDKGTFQVDDYGFVKDFENQPIEATAGYPKKRILEKNFNKLFEMKVKKIYLGEEVFVEPIEELLTQKAFMSREKDIADLRLLKEIGFEKEKLIELAQDKGEIEKIISVLRSCGFEI